MEIISFKVNDKIAKFLRKKGNKSAYIRQLIIKDMHNKRDIDENRIRQIIEECLEGYKLTEKQQESKPDMEAMINDVIN